MLRARRIFACTACRIPTALLICALASATIAQDGQPHQGAAPSTPADTSTGVLLLKNGGVIMGELSRVGDRWFVKNSGRETQLTADQVDLSANSLDELYTAQRRQMTKPTAESHLKLADWCIRNVMLTEAERELAEAKRVDPGNLRLRIYEQRLALAMKPRAGESPPRKETEDTKYAVQTAAAQIVESATRAPVPQLSGAAVEKFTRHVQPILVNNCTTAGCHQSGGAQTLQLDRSLLYGLSNRRTTMNNLQAALSQIDFADPPASPLVAVPRMPHGGLVQPVFGPHQSKMVEQLLEWITLVGDEPNDAQESAEPSSALEPSPVVPTSIAEPNQFDELPARRLPRYGANVQPWQPKDEFDPEIFNRHFLGSRAIAPGP